MYKPFGYDKIPEHLQGYHIQPKHIVDQFPPLYEPLTKEQKKRKYILCYYDTKYADYNGPFK